MLWIYEYGAFVVARKGEAIERGHENNGPIQLDTLFGLVYSIGDHAIDNNDFDNGNFDGMTNKINGYSIFASFD